MDDRFAPVTLVTKETDTTAQVRINHDLAGFLVVIAKKNHRCYNKSELN